MAKNENVLYKVWLSEQVDRFEDAVNYVESYLYNGGKLPPGQRHHLSGAFCKCVAPKRYALEKINLAIEESREFNHPEYDNLLLYKGVIEDEIRQISFRCIKLINTCMKDDDDAEMKALYHCVKADSYRYLCEFETGGRVVVAVQDALEEYKKASEIATSILKPTNAVRLGIAINMCIFYLFIANNAYEAYGIVNSAIQDADAEIANLQENGLDTLVQSCLSQLRDYRSSIQRHLLASTTAEYVN